MRRILFLLFALMAVVCHAATSSLSVEEYAHYTSIPTARLSALSEKYANMHAHPDSGLVINTVIANRYKDRDGDREEMLCYLKALNDLGYLYSTYYLDFERAYDNLLQAVDVAARYHFDDFVANVYLNLAGIYINRLALFRMEDKGNNAMKYLGKAFDTAYRQRQWDVVSNSFYGMISLSGFSDTGNQLRPYISRFVRMPSFSDPMSRYTLDAFNAYKAVQDGDYDDAVRWTKRQLRDSKIKYKVSIQSRFEEFALWQLVNIYKEQEKWSDALATLDTLNEYAGKYGEDDTRMQVLQYRAEVCRLMGDKVKAEYFGRQFVQTQSELFNKSNIERMERSRFVHELTKVNEQLDQSNTRRHRLRVTVLVLTLFIIVIVSAGILIIRSLLKERTYVRKLYEKNVELLRRGERSTAPVAPVKDETEETLDNESGRSISEDDADSPTFGLSGEEKEKLAGRITEIINKPEVFCSPNFSLHQLTQLVGSNDKYVSAFINDYFHKNFKQLLNEVRVNEACRRLLDQEHYGNLTIAAIAGEVGFGSRSNFAVAFKRVTGISPSDFLRQAREHKA